jgi:predicted hotdog family 3-hydroxylacyl-ACP dehydratase
MVEHAGIAALIPHAGRMCLLHEVLAWNNEHIHCRALSHADANNPLRSGDELLAPAGIEYAAQAMAVHGGLLAREAGATAAPGFLASARAVQFHRLRLDDLNGPLDVYAERQAGDETQLLYRFELRHAGTLVAEGRAAVVLNTPLASSPVSS